MERKRSSDLRAFAPASLDKKPRMPLFGRGNSEAQLSNLRQPYQYSAPRYPTPRNPRVGVNNSGPPFQTIRPNQCLFSSGKFPNPGQRYQVQSSVPASSFSPPFPSDWNPPSFQTRPFADGNYNYQDHYLPPSSFGASFQNSSSYMPAPYPKSNATFSKTNSMGQAQHGFEEAQAFPMDDNVDLATGSNKSSTDTSTDRSMRVLTASVEGMKRCAKYTNGVPFMFEVFGVVNSATTGDGSTEAVQFVLKDANGSAVNCIFHQIDRTLPRLTRGQWYRCVGRFSVRDGPPLLRCVSVRLATESEKSSAKTLVQLSENVLQTWIQKSHEM